MNGVMRASITIPVGYIKLGLAKIFHRMRFGILPRVDLRTEISIEGGTHCTIGKKFNMRNNSILRVRKGGVLVFGNNVSMANNCIITCHDKIEIGDDVQLSPGVLIYDHDHDFRAEGGVNAGKYKTAPVIIGDNCWIGANTVILRGTKLGNNCVVGAGSVIKGEYPDGTIIIQKRIQIEREIT